ncbi:MAG: tyrosine-type recombinase/integrase [Acidobacteriota bacterium]
MKRATRFAIGSIVYDQRRRTWHLYTYENGKRRNKLIGHKRDLPNRSAARRAAAEMQQPPQPATQPEPGVPTVQELVTAYLQEKAPTRKDTRRSYQVWTRCHILPKWGNNRITDLQPRPVEMWLESRTLSPKSKAHIRGVLSRVWDYAMWRGDVPSQRNPMSLVDIRGASKRTKKPRSLTIEQAQKFLSNLPQPFHEIALLCLLLGLRISECLALQWGDVDWLQLRLNIDRSIVNQTVEDVKTVESRRNMPLDSSLIDVLKAWKQTSKFSAASDWMFASPSQLGRLPWSYDQVWRVYKKAASAAGIGTLGTHSLRHTYRSLLDSVGTPLAVQQKLMRHTDIRTTMNVYGDVITNQESEALAKIARLALANSTQTARGTA